MNSMGTALAAARERAGLPQSKLAQRLHISRALLGMVETGDRRPTPELLAAAVDATGDLALAIQAMWNSPIGILCGPPLDQADLHPVVVTAKLREELQEADSCLAALRLFNCNRPEDLNDAQRESILKAASEVWDLFTGVQAWLQSMGSHYALDIRRIRQQHAFKLRSRGYTTAVIR